MTVCFYEIASLCDYTVRKGTLAKRQQKNRLHDYGQYIDELKYIEYHAIRTTSNVFVYFDLKEPKSALLKLQFALPGQVIGIKSITLYTQRMD